MRALVWLALVPPCSIPAHAQTLEQITGAMREVGTYAPDPCAALPDFPDVSGKGSTVYDGAVKLALAALNSGPSASPKLSVEGALEPVAKASATVNRAWNGENRFRYEVLALDRLLVLKLGFRSDERWFAFGYAKQPGKAEAGWTLAGEDDMPKSGRSQVSLFALDPGKAHRARFLAHEFWTGCAGSSGIAYQVRAWEPEYATLDTVLSQPGVQGMDPHGGPVTGENPFPTVGKLQTEGRRIQLPYCYTSLLDTWDNPSLCVADTYDLSGEQLSFVSRQVNRPDLLALERALAYADAHDMPALNSYCLSPAVSASLARGFAGVDSELDVKHLSNDLESVTTGAGRFTLRKVKGRWLVASWKPQ